MRLFSLSFPGETRFDSMIERNFSFWPLLLDPDLLFCKEEAEDPPLPIPASPLATRFFTDWFRLADIRVLFLGGCFFFFNGFPPLLGERRSPLFPGRSSLH